MDAGIFYLRGKGRVHLIYILVQYRMWLRKTLVRESSKRYHNAFLLIAQSRKYLYSIATCIVFLNPIA